MRTGVRNARYAVPGDIVVINDRCSLYSHEFATGWKQNGEPGDVCLVLEKPNPSMLTLKIMHPTAGVCYTIFLRVEIVSV